MPRTCTVCSQRSRRKIDAAIAFGQSNRAIASHFGLSRAAVQRHRKHASATIQRAADRRELSVGENVLDRLEDLYSRGLRLLAVAEQKQNHFACIGYLRELRGILGALHEVTGEVLPKPTTKVLPDEFVKAITYALGMRGRLVPLRAEDVAQEPALLPSASHNGQDSNLDIDQVLPR